ncbi:NYN domain-containing protein [Verminephrobacter eiseniae]|nr:NYN domain-containing protein [Verminephrobacter eiseniae]MCW5294467.1 NYN domain-containing protein [Verminephrobacter eiseniae]MCW8186342.1 NYN domain-containing protein [Verminephrobacter eiseniae]MCW8224818.1 NYN domain-containing protein [Verminephrobacter eiseniae]MCW8233040.1 NYN domain-containing protein [Verminephrobacter eiseniae]
MTVSFAILIDGGFAKRRLGSAKTPATADDLQCLVCAIRACQPLENMRLHRVYYYDSVPLETTEKRPLDGGVVEFSKAPVVARSKQLLLHLSRQPLMALRLGELSFNGWSINARKLDRAPGEKLEITKDDLKPEIAQKGVDMRIGMDIAALTLKKQAQVIVLVTADSDFVPAMKFARREGAQLFLAPLGHRIKETMHEHSDLVLALDLPSPAAKP